MKLLRVKVNSVFRGLPQKGIELHFRQDNYQPGDINEPVCLVGLNGTGKSNVLQAICEILYYIELQTLAGKSDLKKIEERYRLLDFEIDYSISVEKWANVHNRSNEKIEIAAGDKVVINWVKPKDKEIEIRIVSYSNNKTISLAKELWSEVLPSKIIGYSSGQNELISNPFIKLDFYYFDEFRKRRGAKNAYGNLDVNRMFFMDYESNELVVLANYLFKNETPQPYDEVEFEKLNERLKIKQLRSFSIKIHFKDYRGGFIEIPSELNVGIEKLKNCATTWNDTENKLQKQNLKEREIELNYHVDYAVRKAFRNQFKTAFELFRLLYLLRLLNIYCYSVATRRTIKQAPRGTNLSELIPKPSLDNIVFKIDGIQFQKTNSEALVRYKELSDGEHQLLHVMGTIKLMNDNDTLFLLDEPETHFNPDWRSKMIKMIINNSKESAEQDFFITSHSPFIISDCKPNNVYIFNRKGNDISIETAAKKRINTFGTSVNILTEELFNKYESIADYSLDILNNIRKRKLNTLKAIQKAKEDSRVLGESVEKILLFRKLITLEEELIEKEKKKKKATGKKKPGKTKSKKATVKKQVVKKKNNKPKVAPVKKQKRLPRTKRKPRATRIKSITKSKRRT